MDINRGAVSTPRLPLFYTQTSMNLAPNQHFVYAWRYKDDTACKLGVSTPRTFYACIKAAKTVTYQEIELLGIEVFKTQAAARAAYQERLETFPRLAGRRAWVLLADAVWEWLKTECLPTPPSLDAFKEVFLKDPVRREKEREYQRRSSQNRAVKRRQRRTEKQRAYEREYARKQRQNNPEYNERRRKSWRKWKQNNPDYKQKRYAEDPEYREKRKVARRKRYAEDSEYREQQKSRWNEWKRQNPNYKRRRAVYMREWRKKNPDYDKKRHRAKMEGAKAAAEKQE